jgi:hypothetical protein
METQIMPGHTLADVLYAHQSFALQKATCQVQQKAINDIIHCRTAYFGGYIAKCSHCGHHQVFYKSCRNRNCPKCQNSKQIVWVDKLKASVLPVKHFHLVFTIPDSLNALFYLNQQICYGLLFKAASKALLKVLANHTGASGGAVAALHTWGQTINYHPHLHMIVPAGGLDSDQMQWIHTQKSFLLPVKVLSGVFRAELMNLIKLQWIAAKLKIPSRYNPDFEVFKKEFYLKKWVVFAEKPFKGPDQIINYLGKYINRVAISNSRIKAADSNTVTFNYKNYKTAEIALTMTLNAEEFISRFMMHILPQGFYKIRYFGIYAQCNTDFKNQCFALLDDAPFIPTYEGLPLPEVIRMETGIDLCVCNKCKQGKMIIIASFHNGHAPFT